MKKIYYLIIVVATFCAALEQPASAQLLPPYFNDVRSEITNQLNIANSTVPLDRKLIGKLEGTLKTIDRNETLSLAPGVRTLGLVVKNLNKTSVSNIFDASLQEALTLYTSNYFSAHSNLQGRLDSTLLGKPRATAQVALDDLMSAVNAADTNFNSGAAANALSLASKNLSVANRAVTRAEAAEQTGGSLAATWIRERLPTQNLSAKPPQLSLQSFDPITRTFVINATQTKGGRAHSFSFRLTNLLPGYQSVIASGDYSITGEASFVSTSGSSQVTWNPNTQSLFGSVKLNGVGGSRIGRVASIFTIYY